MLVGAEQRLDPLSAELATAPLGSDPAGAGPDVLGFAACAAVVRRSAFLEVGGFGPVVNFPGEEERVALDLVDAGWILSYVDDLVAHHHPSPRRSDPASRQKVITRNALLTAVQRRPWTAVLSRAAADWRAGGPRRAGVLAAGRSLPLALRHRHRVSPEVERRIRLLAGG
jgi:3',5'-cyclic AMP phosphodiesterase CpdA